MSSPEQMSFATMHDTGASNLSVLTAQLFAGLCELMRLNLDTCSSVFAGAGLHWESLVLAQTPEQLIRRQADSLPWLALQIAGYTRGWMDIASEATANLSGSACDRHDGHVRHVSTLFDGMAKCERGVEAMMAALNPAPSGLGGDAVVRPPVDSPDVARADCSRAAEAAPDAAERRSTSPGRLESSR